ncbi:MAG: hypothetical protein QF699_07160, partial [Candidatus Poseidoniaceae archaeon]|nr:hypothetical protein [Candidatus Poseidoniaceae archaeon]
MTPKSLCPRRDWECNSICVEVESTTETATTTSTETARRIPEEDPKPKAETGRSWPSHVIYQRLP